MLPLQTKIARCMRVVFEEIVRRFARPIPPGNEPTMKESELDPSRLRYDAASKTLTYAATEQGAAFPAALGKTLAATVRSGRCDEGPVAHGAVEFADDATAAKNADALAFLSLASVGPSGVANGGARFAVREDFGIE